ncbi:MAG TPA: segregation/condensation protein A [Polyangiaceae bacterium]|nr:segregation/condensation protein A [Polyangiaceae bacterium]
MSGKAEISKGEESQEPVAAQASAPGGAESKPAKGAGRRSRAVAAEATAALAPQATPELEVLPGAYQVALPAFEGPLDLLLHLIQQHQLDILDIPIGFVAERYVEYIMVMQELNIDMASEYLVMAATLAHIKSKMLLPTPPADQEDDAAEDLDPRGELVRRLLEYQKYKHAAEALGAAPVLGRDVFVRGAPAPEVDGPAPLAQVSVFKLFDAFQKLLGRVKQTAEHHIDVDRISISERILQLTDILKGQGPYPFEKLFGEEVTRSDLVVTFLAILEMTRLRMMQVLQEGPLEAILVELTLTDEHEDVLAHTRGEDPLVMLARGTLPTGSPPASDSVSDSASADEDSADEPGAEDEAQAEAQDEAEELTEERDEAPSEESDTAATNFDVDDDHG